MGRIYVCCVPLFFLRVDFLYWDAMTSGAMMMMLAHAEVLALDVSVTGILIVLGSLAFMI